MTDPWLTENSNEETPSVNIENKFEDSFVDLEKLPDSEEYLKSLENKLAKIKRSGSGPLKSKDIINSLSEAKDCHLTRLVNGTSDISLNDVELNEPIQVSNIRLLSTDRKAQTLGEIVELLKYDQLARALETEDDISNKE